MTAGPRTTRATVPAPPEAVWAAFMDPGQLVEWLPPAGMTGVIHSFDARVGGGYDMSLFYPREEHEFAGKTADHEDRVTVRFTEVDAPRRIVETTRFVTTDATLEDEMTITITLAPTDGGTEVAMLFENLPPGLKPEDNAAGARISLEQLARRFSSAPA